jgi:hypothetical protein
MTDAADAARAILINHQRVSKRSPTHPRQSGRPDTPNVTPPRFGE